MTDEELLDQAENDLHLTEGLDRRLKNLEIENRSLTSIAASLLVIARNSKSLSRDLGRIEQVYHEKWEDDQIA